MNARGTFRRIVCCALTALLLLSGIQPYSAAVEPEDRRDHIIVSLGDSYASGEGIPPFYGQDDIKQWSLNKPLDWLAHRSMSSWSGRLTLHPSVSGTMADHPGTHWFFVAASGAKTKDLQHPQKKKVNNTNLDALANLATVMPFTDYYFELPPQLEVFDYLDANGLKADYVTVSLGGNDVYFADIVTKAAIEGSYISFYSLQKKIEKIWEEFDSTIQYRIRDAYKLIADRAGPQAAVLVVGYPGLINPKGSKVFFNDWEAQYIDVQVSLFNERLREIVRFLHDDQHCNIHFVSVEEAFFEHEAYSEKPSYMNGIIMPAQPYDLDITKPVSDYSMHPNWEGARVYAECVQKKIDELEALRDTSAPPAANTNQGRADADLWGAIDRSGVCGYISKTFDEIDAQTGELEGVEVEYELGLRNLYFFKGSSILYSFETDLSEIELSTETGFLPGSLVRKYLKGTDRCNGVALRQLSLIGFTGEVNAKDIGAEVYQNEEYEDLWMAFAKHDGCDFVFICDDSSGTISKDSYCWFSKDLPAQATQTPAQTNRNGWVNEGRSAESWEEGEWYYYSSGRPVTGWQTIDGETYYFLSDGRMAQSITEINGTRYYFREHFYGAGPSTGGKPEHGTLSHGGYEQRSDSSMVYCDSKGRVVAYDGMVNGRYFEFALAAFSLIWDEDRLTVLCGCSRLRIL